MKAKNPMTKGDLAVELLADILRTFRAKNAGKLTRKEWNEFKNSICGAIEKISEHDI